MAKRTTKVVPSETTLSEKEIARAVTNAPALAADEFTIKDRTFKIVDLEYDDYLNFISMFKPVFEKITGTQASDTSLPGIPLANPTSLKIDAILAYCKDDLPALACIVCNAQEKAQALLDNRAPNPDNMVTVAWLKKNSNPLKLAGLVLKQLMNNNMITDFADFFVQALPLLKAMRM
jgi:hypothetical protein